MKNSIDISSALYQLVNTIEVKNTISGKVYINDIPNGDQKENIAVGTLTNDNKYLQVGFANVNIFVKETKSGRPNLKRFQEIVKVVMPLLEDAKINGYFFQIDSDNGLMKNSKEDGLFFYNFKLSYQTI
ncbi:MAG: hypothetical protein KGV59_05430 [Tenacibaculum sp.]|nr:hypothetical protein [Tenacibaculum sp.]